MLMLFAELKRYRSASSASDIAPLYEGLAVIERAIDPDRENVLSPTSQLLSLTIGHAAFGKQDDNAHALAPIECRCDGTTRIATRRNEDSQR